MKPKIRKRYDTDEDVLNDDGEPVEWIEPEDRPEDWDDKYREVDDEEAGL